MIKKYVSDKDQGTGATGYRFDPKLVPDGQDQKTPVGAGMA